MKIRPKLCPHPDSLWTERPLASASVDLHFAGSPSLLEWRLLHRCDGRDIGCIRLVPDGTGARLTLGVADEDSPLAEEAVRRLLRLCFDVLALECVDLGGELPFLPLRERLGFPLTREEWRIRHATRPILLVAAAVLIDSDGRILLAQRPQGKSMAGLWEFPGGKINASETPERALVRELHEELGIEISANCLAPLTFASHDYDTFHLLMPLFLCRVWLGIPQGRENQTLAWVRSGALASYPMPPADLPLIASIRESMALR